jgi:hypothetical protein
MIQTTAPRIDAGQPTLNADEDLRAIETRHHRPAKFSGVRARSITLRSLHFSAGSMS